MWSYSIAAYFYDWASPLVRYQFHPIFIIGGFLFGLGASINQACSISTMNQLAKGHVGKILTICGWFFGWSIWTQTLARSKIKVEYKVLEQLSFTSTLITSVIVLILTIIFAIRFRPPIKLVLGISGIGLIASLLFYLAPYWTPSLFVRDLGNSVLYEKPVPSLFLRMGIITALLLGMWIAVFINKNARIKFPSWRSGLRFLVASTMMGIGAAMALGGNDTQLLFGIPATAPGALTALLFMFVGIVCEQLLYQRGAAFYQKS